MPEPKIIFDERAIKRIEDRTTVEILENKKKTVIKKAISEFNVLAKKELDELGHLDTMDFTTFASRTGLVVSSTGYIIRISGVDVYKKNGKILTTALSKEGRKLFRLQTKQFRKLPTRKNTLRIDLIVFSVAPYSVALHNPNRRRRKIDNKLYQGTYWFYDFSAGLYNHFQSTLRNKNLIGKINGDEL